MLRVYYWKCTYIVVEKLHKGRQDELWAEGLGGAHL